MSTSVRSHPSSRPWAWCSRTRARAPWASRPSPSSPSWRRLPRCCHSGPTTSSRSRGTRSTAFIFSSLLILGFAFFCLASFFSWLLVSSLGAPSAGAGAVSTGFCVSEDCASGVVLCGSMRCLTHYLSIEINNRGIQINTGERTAKVENRRNHPDFWMKRQRLPK